MVLGICGEPLHPCPLPCCRTKKPLAVNWFRIIIVFHSLVLCWMTTSKSGSIGLSDEPIRTLYSLSARGIQQDA